eukprot:1654879-Rhodomonas_salina.2
MTGDARPAYSAKRRKPREHNHITISLRLSCGEQTASPGLLCKEMKQRSRTRGASRKSMSRKGAMSGSRWFPYSRLLQVNSVGVHRRYWIVEAEPVPCSPDIFGHESESCRAAPSNHQHHSKIALSRVILHSAYYIRLLSSSPAEPQVSQDESGKAVLADGTLAAVLFERFTQSLAVWHFSPTLAISDPDPARQPDWYGRADCIPSR